MNTEYNVTCHVCEDYFDASTAPWCKCLVTEPSVVCPSCNTCFCDAPVEYQREFWSVAPQTLWEARRREVEARAQLGPNPSTAEAKRPLVLVADDDREVHETVLRASVSLGCGFVRARDGHAALNLARRYRPDLILADAELPRLDGREMCRQLKDDPVTTAFRIVIVTGWWWKPVDVEEITAKYRADDHLAKPFSYSELVGLLRKHVAPNVDPRELRRYPRFRAAVRFHLKRLAARDGEQQQETVTTLELGKGGGRVPTSLPIDKDELIHVAEVDGSFQTRASVRRVTIGEDRVPQLHLWFLDGELPDRLLPEKSDARKGSEPTTRRS